MTVEQFIEKMPKIELHVHLEGAIPLEILFEFIRRDRTETSIKSLDNLKEKFLYKDFEHFIQIWGWKNRFIKSEKDFEVIIYEVLRYMSLQHVIYVEMFYSPGDFFLRQGLSIQSITEYLIAGKERAFNDFNIQCNLIVDLVRDYGPDTGMEILKKVTPYIGKGLVGIGLGGSEQYYPAGVYKEVYRKAKDLGCRLTAHAGEAAGTESIWDVLENLHVERIGHGVRAYEDTKLVSFLKEKQIPLEICPVSNVKTGIFKSVETHPVIKYFTEGLMVTINSDDPLMFNTSITEEYLSLARNFTLSVNDVKQLCMNSINSSFMKDNNKQLMKDRFERKWKEIECVREG
ncbi:MAG: adenosine deaminase [Candidatus Eremiobacterota bacterium]